MKVDIIKELDRNRSNTQNTAESLVNEVKLLMDESARRERDALYVAGLTAHIEQVENAKGTEITRQKNETAYGERTFTEAELKAICVKYDLRMLRAKLFNGKLDGEVAPKLARFIENNKYEIGNQSGNFFVIAPPNSFKLSKRPVKVRDVDPVLLYKVPKEDQYVFVHKWGRDFTLWRRFLGMFYSSVFSMWAISSSVMLFVSGVLYAIFNQEFVGEFEETIKPILVFSFFSLLGGFLFLGALFGEFEDFDERTSDYLWNRENRRSSW